MLPIVTNPICSPVVFGECVDASPQCQHGAIVEFLRAPALAKPNLANEKYNGEDDSIGDEGASHDEMRSALSEIVALAEAQCRDSAKNQLDP